MTSGSDKGSADEHVFLIGRPPLAEYIGFIETMTLDGQNADRGALANEWRAANDHINELEKGERGYADNPGVAELPPSLQPLGQQVMINPMFQRAYAIVPTEIGMIELDRMVVFQKFINLDYVRQIQSKLGTTPSEEEIFDFCLPFDQPVPPFQVRRVAANSYVFVSPSNDLRFMDSVTLLPTQVSGYQARGPIAGVIGLVVGFTANCLSAIHAENRLILNNGSHRAFALRDMGITRVPCVVQNVSRRDELPMVVGEPVSKEPDLYLKTDRPPLLKDYFDPKLRKLAKVPKKSRQVKIAFGQEPIDV